MTTLVTAPVTYSNGVLETGGSANWARRLTDDLAMSSNHVARCPSDGGRGGACVYTNRNAPAPAAHGSGGTAQLYSAVAGSYTELGNVSHGSANALVYAEAQGTAIKLFLNGTQRISVTNSAITTGNFAGIAMYKDASAVSPQIDD